MERCLNLTGREGRSFWSLFLVELFGCIEETCTAMLHIVALGMLADYAREAKRAKKASYSGICAGGKEYMVDNTGQKDQKMFFVLSPNAVHGGEEVVV